LDLLVLSAFALPLPDAAQLESLASRRFIVLSLNDSRWSQFQANYTSGGRVAELLARAESGEPLDDWYDELFQELCHQYTVSEAAYPAGPHLVRLAMAREQVRTPLLVLLGACHAFSDPSEIRPVPADIDEEWHASAREAIPLIAGLLAEPQPSESGLRYLLSSLAAVSGYRSLASAIEGLDCDSE
jgi:hypothetical protein